MTQAAEQTLVYAELLQDHSTHLFFHGYEDDCGPNGRFWARGNGWALMGIVDTLTLLPNSDTRRRTLEQRLHSLCEALAQRQDESGLWRHM